MLPEFGTIAGVKDVDVGHDTLPVPPDSYSSLSITHMAWSLRLARAGGSATRLWGLFGKYCFSSRLNVRICCAQKPVSQCPVHQGGRLSRRKSSAAQCLDQTAR